MGLQYIGLSEINGPLVAIDHVVDASYDEMVEIKAVSYTHLTLPTNSRV